MGIGTTLNLGFFTNDNWIGWFSCSNELLLDRDLWFSRDKDGWVSLQWIKLQQDWILTVGFRRSGSVFSRMSALVFVGVDRFSVGRWLWFSQVNRIKFFTDNGYLFWMDWMVWFSRILMSIIGMDRIVNTAFGNRLVKELGWFFRTWFQRVRLLFVYHSFVDTKLLRAHSSTNR